MNPPLRQGHHRVIAAVMVALGLLVPGPPTGRAQTNAASVSEPEAKAAFLYTFAKLTDWPEAAFTNATAPLVIGVLGRDTLGKALEETTRGKSVKGRPVVLARFNSVKEVRDCQVLFVAASERARWGEIRLALKGRPILTVSDFEEFPAKGGMIGLSKADTRLRFEVNTAAARAAGLKLGSQMLQFARKIHTTNP